EEAGRHHTDDVERGLPDADLSSDSAWIAREAPLPEAVADDRDGAGALHPVYFFGKRSTQQRALSQNREVSAADQTDARRLSLATLAYTLHGDALLGPATVSGKDAGEDLVVIAQPLELVIGEQFPISRLLPAVHPVRIGVREKDKLLRILSRKRAEQDGIEDGEKGRVRANAQRQRQYGYQGEARILHQHSRAVAQVLP